MFYNDFRRFGRPHDSYLMGQRRELGRTHQAVAGALLIAMLVVPVVNTSRAAAAPNVAASPTTKSTPTKKVKSPLPVMNVTDVKTGKSVALAATFNGTKPMLVWFWAPH